MELPKIDTSNLWDKTYNILKERIIRREFRPNQKLLIPELAEQLGVSRTPIRDALNRLEMDGLVTTVSKVGTFVNGIEIHDVLDIMDTRMMLEFWVAEKLADVPKEELEKELMVMEAIIQRSLKDIKTLSLKQYLQNDYNMAFHLKFMELGRNNKNTEIYKNIMNYRFLAAETSLISEDMITTAANQHLAIIQSLRDGNVQQIKSVIKIHLDDSKERLILKIDKNGGII
ncbi:MULTISPECIES: GntR family transcriptional regulator [Paenibacillus]|uniref:GntR family transcriptional regulator n=1 Tax=Paenibacillus naphthalenovorans TaxID=162209 RepID=A0A0U2MZ98_9BACL|nr:MULTISPECIES: GntR family transcriptional regulator [Paenibacillus]ALS23727.1 GntR family transcriptional regulator [Paenibacillus naphthalenovorans]GCL73565.1 GntR family transcriptional regulator [Paenibacillus naphthalenovorans]